MRTLILVGLVVTFGSCRQQDDLAQLRAINEGLVQANGIITSRNDQYYHTLESRMSDPQVISLTKPWYPGAARVYTLCRELQAHIDQLDSLLTTQRGLPSSAKNAFFESLVIYKGGLLTAFDSSIRAQDRRYISEGIWEINRHSKVLKGYADSIRSVYSKKWIDSAFGSSDPMIISLSLKKIKNDIALEEYERLKYVESITNWEPDSFLRFYPTMRIEPDDVKAGQEVEVCAGIVGGYIDLARLGITIDGIPSPVIDKDRAMAVRRIRASNVPGKHVIPVTVEMTFPNGASFKSVNMLTYRVHN